MASFASLDTPRSLWSRSPSTARRASAATTASASYDVINSAPSEALLLLVARGNVLLTDLLRLSAQLPRNLSDQQSRFAAVLPDFDYLKDSAAAEQAIEASPALVALDDEFREMHMGLLESLYRLYERIISYHRELTAWLTRLRGGVYIHASVESMLLGLEERQLMIEAPALLGAIMLLLDHRVPSLARERSVVAYFRARGGAQAVGPSINAVIALCAGTGCSQTDSWLPTGYPETYLARLPLPSAVVNALLSRLRSDDVYCQIVHYPSPQHRSTALAQQAGQLYVLLFYAPEVLQSDSAMMRVLVDKHFVDSWVVSWAPGASADLSWEWANYKAAKTVLCSVVTPALASQLAGSYAAALPNMSRQLGSFLVDGLIREDAVLQEMEAILDALRACNVAVRWLMLHSRARHPRLAPGVAAASPPPAAIVSLIMETSLLEFEVRRVYSGLLESREERWAQARAAVVDTLSELSQFYSGDGVLARRLADDGLAHWLAHLADQVEHFVLGSDSRRRVRAAAAALDEAEGHHAVEASAQARQHLDTARSNLATMIHIDHVGEEVLVTLAAVSDFSFAWGLLEPYTAALQAQVRVDPAAVLKLRCVFLKLRSGLELPLLRVLQIGGAAAASLTEYYSSALLAYVRKVLQVLPSTVLELVDSVVKLYAGGLQPPKGRLPIADLRSHAQLYARAEFASLTHRIAALAQGVLAMERTFMGVIEIDPFQLLEDGLRVDIRRRITAAMATSTTWSSSRMQPLAACCGGGPAAPSLSSLFGGSQSEAAPDRRIIEATIAALASKLEGLRDGVEACQDYIAVRGLWLWHQEFAAAIRRNLAKEMHHSFRGASSPARSSGSSQQPATKPVALTFPKTCLGRLTAQMLHLTNPHSTSFQTTSGAWFVSNPTTGAASGGTALSPDEALNAATIRTVGRAVGPCGLAAIDRLLGFRIQEVLQRMVADVRRSAAIPAIHATLQDSEQLRSDTAGSSLPAMSATAAPEQAVAGKARRLIATVQTAIAAVGQATLLRQQLALELRLLYEQQAGDTAADTLAALSASVVGDACHALLHANPMVPPPLLEGGFLPRLSAQLDDAGLGRAEFKQYMQPGPHPPQLPLLLYLAMAAQLPGWQADPLTATLKRRTTRSSSLDPSAFMAGLALLLRQLPARCWKAFLARCGALLREHIAAATGSAAAGFLAAGVEVGLPPEVPVLVAVLAAVEQRGGVPSGSLPQYVPGLILEAHSLAAL